MTIYVETLGLLLKKIHYIIIKIGYLLFMVFWVIQSIDAIKLSAVNSGIKKNSVKFWQKDLR